MKNILVEEKALQLSKRMMVTMVMKVVKVVKPIVRRASRLLCLRYSYTFRRPLTSCVLKHPLLVRLGITKTKPSPVERN